MSLITTSRSVDLEHLSRYTGDDSELKAEVLGLFTTQAKELLQRLGAALEKRDSKDWYQTAHSLKGAARGIGAFALGDAAAAAEEVDPAAQPDEAAVCLKTMRNRSQSVQHFIDAYLGVQRAGT